MYRTNCQRALILVFVVSGFVTAKSFAQSTGGLVNKPGPGGVPKKWVARRNDGDPNKNNHLAAALWIKESGSTLTATLWTYPTLDNMTNKYINPTKYEDLAQVNYEIKPGSARRNRETATFAKTMGNKTVTVYVTLYRNEVPGNGMGHGPRKAQRVVLRYTIKDANEKRRTVAADDCEEEPNEDVLEEEAVTNLDTSLNYESP